MDKNLNEACRPAVDMGETVAVRRLTGMTFLEAKATGRRMRRAGRKDWLQYETNPEGHQRLVVKGSHRIDSLSIECALANDWEVEDRERAAFRSAFDNAVKSLQELQAVAVKLGML